MTTRTIESLIRMRKTPLFINKYLSLKEIDRLRYIGYYCGMDYASKDYYHFNCFTSRYHHSLNVCNNAYYLTHNKTEAMAGLLHDISSPCFSHTIDYMNQDYLNQESTEEKTKEIILGNKQMLEYFKKDKINIDALFECLDNSVVNNNRPKLCLDRVDGIIIPALTWLNIIDLKEAKKLYKDLVIYNNENNELEVSFKNENNIKRIVELSNIINEEIHKSYDIFFMDTLAFLVKELITNKVITYDELYHLTEPQLIKIIDIYSQKHPDFNGTWYAFKNSSIIPSDYSKEVKEKTINPILKLDFNRIIRYN